MKKIIFIANNNVGRGFSGGDRIFIEFVKNWADKLEIIFFGSEEAIKIAKDRNIQEVKIIETSKRARYDDLNSVCLAAKHIARRTKRGIAAIRKNHDLLQDFDYVYSVSDFFPDLIPALYLKLKNKKMKWMAGFYLFAPNPLAKDSPYKGKNRAKGFFYWLSQRLAYWLIRRFADFVFVTSEPDAEKFVTKKRDKSKIIVVRGGVDLAESEKWFSSGEVVPPEERKYDACFVGRLHPQKGVLELIDIWKKVCQEKNGAKLAIIGNGPLEEKIKDKIFRHNLEKNIDLLGFRDGAEKYEIFKESKMILHPAIYDSGGMAAAEGMAWELPAVSFDLGALKSYYPQGMLKASRFDLEDFAKNIISLLEDEKLYKKISEEALALVREKWDWRKRAEEIFESIHEYEKEN